MEVFLASFMLLIVRCDLKEIFIAVFSRINELNVIIKLQYTYSDTVWLERHIVFLCAGINLAKLVELWLHLTNKAPAEPAT